MPGAILDQRGQSCGAGAQHARVLKAAANRTALQPRKLLPGARWLEAARLACPGRGEEGGVSCWGATAGKPWGRGFQTCFDVIKHLAVSVLDLAHGAHFSCPSKLGHFRTVTATSSAGSRLPGLVERTCAVRQAPLQRLLLAGLGSRVARRSPSRSCLKEGNRLREAGWSARSRSLCVVALEPAYLTESPPPPATSQDAGTRVSLSPVGKALGRSELHS